MEENRQKRSPKWVLMVSIVIVVAVVLMNLLWSWAFGQKPTYQRTHSVTQYELPRRLTDRPEQILKKEGFVISFNSETNCPNYVAWYLTASRAKARSVHRKDEFNGDPQIPANRRVETQDYYNSRYDRGHMCPSGDNKHSRRAMDDCFLMTNMCPQAHALNIGAWNDLEQECRRWAKNYGAVAIVCGPIYDSKSPQRFGRRGHRVAVPDRFFKVVLMRGRIPKAIGFIYPNRNATRPMRNYAISVDEVERLTGIDFFYQLDDKTENRIEAECNPAAWNL